MNMQERIEYMQSQGYLVTYDYDTNRSTNMLVTHPDGKSYYLYPDWKSLDDDRKIGLLQNGEQADVSIDPEISYPNEFEMMLEANQSLTTGEQSLEPFTISFLLAIIIIATLIAVTYWVQQFTTPKCEARTEDITDCEKMVIKPDCSTATFNICVDEDGDGVYEGKYTSDWSGGTEWSDYADYIIIGAVVVGGIFILSKIDFSSMKFGKTEQQIISEPSKIAPEPSKTVVAS